MTCDRNACESPGTYRVKTLCWVAAKPDAVAEGTTSLVLCQAHALTLTADDFWSAEGKEQMRAAFRERGFVPPDTFDIKLEPMS